MYRGSDVSADADVLILGASMAGIEVLHQLRRSDVGRRLQVTLVDRQREHPYIPLIHERLCGRIGEAESTLPTEQDIAGDPRASLRQGEIVGFDPEAREVTLADGARLRGRFVVVALGSVITPPTSLPGWERAHACKAAEASARAQEALRACLVGDGDPPAIVVVGGGISGVEMAGELAHLARARPAGWRAPRVSLVHGGARLLPHMSERASRRSLDHLQAQGVEVRLRARVRAIEADAVVVDGEAGEVRLPAALVFWGGGVRPSPILAELGLPRTPDGWLAVGPTLQCFPSPRPTRPEVFACGDAARVIGGDGEWPTMQRAIECLWQAKVVARGIAALAAEPADFPRGVPPVDPHVLRRDFFHGVSLGARSLIVYGGLVVDVPALGVWFRRFLMRRYFARYAASGPAGR